MLRIRLPFAAAAAMCLFTPAVDTAEAKRAHMTTSSTAIGHVCAYGSERSEDGAMALSDLNFVEDIDDLQKEADAKGTGLLWFRIDGRSYRVRDGAAVERAEGIVAL